MAGAKEDVNPSYSSHDCSTAKWNIQTQLYFICPRCDMFKCPLLNVACCTAIHRTIVMCEKYFLPKNNSMYRKSNSGIENAPICLQHSAPGLPRRESEIRSHGVLLTSQCRIHTEPSYRPHLMPLIIKAVPTNHHPNPLDPTLPFSFRKNIDR